MLISELRQEILKSRLQAAKLVNRELLLLYYKAGMLMTKRFEAEKWGAKVMDTLSADLQKAFPGLRGFSKSNLTNMRLFYQAYSSPEFLQSLTVKLQNKDLEKLFLQSLTGKFVARATRVSEGPSSKKNQKAEREFERNFFAISFTHHIHIVTRTKTWQERFFYILQSAADQWSTRMLDYHLEAKLHKKKGKLQNNFHTTIPSKFRDHAILAFKDEYLLDFINIKDPENFDERELETGIINNLKTFILSLGKEFSFMGNQYRLVVDEEEYFIDLLFFHRGLQSLIAFELKSGKFKPEYAGKMNFYLNALNDLVKLPHENPSIGVILCKEKKDSIVEYSFKDVNKPIGVGKYKFTDKLPTKLKKYLPEPEALIRVLNDSEQKTNT